MGPFYVAFREDAEIVAKELGLKLHWRGAPASFLSRQRANDHLQRLVRLGFPIEIHEELETQAAARARGARLIRREWVRKITPGEGA
jgi:DNA mismatch repair ATPase MutS